MSSIDIYYTILAVYLFIKYVVSVNIDITLVNLISSYNISEIIDRSYYQNYFMSDLLAFTSEIYLCLLLLNQT